MELLREDPMAFRPMICSFQAKAKSVSLPKKRKLNSKVFKCSIWAVRILQQISTCNQFLVWTELYSQTTFSIFRNKNSFNHLVLTIKIRRKLTMWSVWQVEVNQDQVKDLKWKFLPNKGRFTLKLFHRA